MHKGFRTGFAIAVLGLSTSAMAGGFQISEASGSGLGNAYAGSAALPEDASIGFWNPAGLTQLGNYQIVAAGTMLNLNSDVRIPQASSVLGPTQGDHREEAGGWFLIPAFHASTPKIGRFAFGLGVTTPYGLTTSYTSRSRSRYFATYSNLVTINVGPSVGFEVNRHLSLGAGVDFQYLTTTLKQKLPTLGGDAEYKNEADDWAIGWNAGVLCHFDTGTQVGLHYRSRINHKVTGSAFINSPEVTVEGDASARVTIPDTFNLSLNQKINACWDLLASYHYTHWRTIDTVTLDYTDSLGQFFQPSYSTSLDLNFQNTSKVALAVNYHPCEQWRFRLGSAYDGTNVKSRRTRSFRLPDNNRIWLALGAQYNVNRCVSVDMGYAHLFVHRAYIEARSEVASANATVDGSVNQFGAQLTWNFS